MADNDNTAADSVFNADKPSKLKTAFQYATAVVSTISGEGPNYGWEAGGNAYDYAKTWLGSKGAGLSKPASGPASA